MPRWLICTSSSRAIAALCAVTALLPADRGLPSTADVRPQMTITADIQGRDFAELLPSPGRDALLRLMQDSLRIILERNFGFLNWRNTGGAAIDTLGIHWIQQGNSSTPDAMLQL